MSKQFGTNMNEDFRVFQAQFASIMEILLSAAMTETAKLYQSCVLELRTEISRVQAENNTLKCRVFQTAENVECHLEQNEEWMTEGSHFNERPLSGSGTTKADHAEVIIQEDEAKEGAPLIKVEASDSQELKGICQIPSDVQHTEIQMKIISDPGPNREWRPPSNDTDLQCKTKIKLESSPRPKGMKIVTEDQSSVDASVLQNVFHEGHTSADWSEYAHFADQQHTNHSKPQTPSCTAPLTPSGNRFTADISTFHYHHQTEEQSNYNISLPLPNRPAHTPSITTGKSTRTLQKTVPSRHLPISPLPGGSQHRCKECGKTFHSRRGLCGHLQVHQGERTHRCSLCGKSFLYQSRLTHHLRAHTGKDGYSCRFCQRKFASKANLSVHLVSHAKEHPFQCSVCGLTFGNRTVLHTHLKSHSGEPRYTCAQCGKKFCDLGNFSRHKRIHTGERPYSCEVCGKSFIQSAHLKKHQLTHRRG